MDHSYSTERERLQKVDHAYFSIGKKTPKVVLRKAQSNKEQQGDKLLVDKDHSYHRINPISTTSKNASLSDKKKPHLSLYKISASNKSKAKYNSRKTSTKVNKIDKITIKSTKGNAETSDNQDIKDKSTAKVFVISDEEICTDNYSDHSYYKDSFSLLIDALPLCSKVSTTEEILYQSTDFTSPTICNISNNEEPNQNYDLSQLKISCSLDHAYFNGNPQLFQVSLSTNQCS